MDGNNSKANGRRHEKRGKKEKTSNELEPIAGPLPHLLGSPDRRPAMAPQMVLKQVAIGETLTESALKNLKAMPSSTKCGVQPPPGLEIDSALVSNYRASLPKSSPTAENGYIDDAHSYCDAAFDNSSGRKQIPKPLPEWLAPKTNNIDGSAGQEAAYRNAPRSALREKGQNALVTMQRTPKLYENTCASITTNLDSLRARGNTVLADVSQSNQRNAKRNHCPTISCVHPREFEEIGPTWQEGIPTHIRASMQRKALAEIRNPTLGFERGGTAASYDPNYTNGSMKSSTVHVVACSGVSETVEDQFIDNVFNHKRGSHSVCTAQDGMPMKIEMGTLMSV
jgi:hypothetical protein